MQKRFKVKLLLVQLLSILPFLIFIFYLFDLWYDSRRLVVLQDNVASAKAVEGFINKSLDTALTLGKFIATDTNLQKIIATDPSQTTATLKNIKSIKPELLSLSILDLDGKIIATSEDLTESEKQITFEDRDYFQETISTKREVISNPIIGRYSDQQVLGVVVPTIKNGQVTAIVRISYSLEYLNNEMKKLVLDANSKTVFVIDRDKNIALISDNQLPDEKEKGLFSELDFIKNPQEKNVILIENQNLPIINRNSLGASVLNKESGWIVVSVEPSESIFAPIFKLQSYIWLILISAFIFTFTLFTYFLRKVRIIY